MENKIFNQRIENARELYSVDLLNEKFTDPEENKIRKEKLNKLYESIFIDGLKQKKK